MTRILLWLALCALTLPASAAIRTATVRYVIEGTPHIGYLAYDDDLTGTRPGVLVVPEWWGLNDYARERTRELAAAGYVAFAADMYGGGRTTRDKNEAAEWSKAASLRLRELTRSAFDQLAHSPRVDPARLGAIGFCFGGTSVLELAYSGADVKAVVSLHGHLTRPAKDDLIHASILVLQGTADPMAPMADINALVQSYEARPRLDWSLSLYGHAQHAFTNPAADSYGIQGVAYNATAARRAWSQTRRFLAERLGKDNPVK